MWFLNFSFANNSNPDDLLNIKAQRPDTTNAKSTLENQTTDIVFRNVCFYPLDHGRIIQIIISNNNNKK